MKKILFLSLMAVTVLTGRSYAQQNVLVAVLTHEGTNTTFHGAGALAEANEAAVDGDVITLSGGTFNGITLSKGITIRGAGMNRNEETNVDRTMINQLTIEPKSVIRPRMRSASQTPPPFSRVRGKPVVVSCS